MNTLKIHITRGLLALLMMLGFGFTSSGCSLAPQKELHSKSFSADHLIKHLFKIEHAPAIGDSSSQTSASGYAGMLHFTEVTLLILIALVIAFSIIILLTRRSFSEDFKQYSDFDSKR